MTIGRIIDISSQQHPHGAAIDWNKVAADGVTAAFVKATSFEIPGGYINPYLQSDMIAAQNAGLAVCAYHFVADGGTAGTDPVAEAHYFMRYASRFARMLDYETNTDVAWARAFLQALELGPADLITYGSLSSLVNIYKQLPSMAFPAAYDQGFPGWGVCWQFTDAATVAGIVGDVDESSWHGDETQYETLFQLNIAPVPIGGLMAISPTFVHNGQKQVVQASGQTIWHKYYGLGQWNNETLAGPGGGTAAGCAGFKVTVAPVEPKVTTYQDGSVDVTFEGTDGSAWLVSQAQGSASWTGGKLP